MGAAATICGMALVVGSVAGPGDSTIIGDLLMILASVAWAGYTVGSRPLVAHYGAIPVTAWTLCIGAVGVVLLGLPDLAHTDLAALPVGAWLSVIYAGAMSIGVAYLIWYHGVRQIGNTRTSVYSNLVPVVALAVAWAWLGETPSLRQVIGALIIISGVTLAQARRDVARGTYESVVRS
jgi:drug/metabolite transporter (DMT)-like permease